METTLNSLYSLKKPQENEENFTMLFKNPHVRIEGIRSNQKTLGQMYCQTENEWVLLFKGSATLKLKENLYHLKSGDYLFIPKYTPHYVVSTDEDAIWLGVFSS